MANRLAGATSPYLLQHQDNPVDWWPWCPEAFEEARRRDVPVLLSIGYSACHWCHVMAHESFEDAGTAAYLNEHFVPVKVDREERPDVDAVYMEATTAMTGHGGWPMTCFLTPDGEPFYCGTYFPPEPRHGMPAFGQVLAAIAQAWQTQGEDVRRAATDVVRQLSGQGYGDVVGGELTATMADAAANVLGRDFDAERGGFGGAPKFPPSMCLEFLLRHAARTGDRRSLAMVERTCEAMARGGMYDQLGGGFARYSVDADWVVPHFEKMLYDNALLLRVYLHLWRQTGSELARRVAVETADFLVRELRTPQGGFASALDADSEGEEGRFYVWTPAQLRDALGDGDGAWAAEVLSVTEAGTFEHGTSVLRLLGDPGDPTRYAALRLRLLEHREQRVRPGRDDKVVAAWNGLAIAALAEGGRLLDRPDLVEAAAGAAELLERVHVVDGGRLRRTSRDGRAGDTAGVLEDYGDVAEGLVALYAVTSEPRWVALAGRLLDTVLDHFADGHGGFYDTADDAERLVRRPQDPTDNATPSGASAVAGALLSYGALSQSARHREAAEAALRRVVPLIAQHPRFAGWAAAVLEAVLAGPAEVAVVGPLDDERTRALADAALAAPSAGAVLAVTEPPVDGAPAPVPLLDGKGMAGGQPTAYLCRGFTCGPPMRDPAELAAALGRPAG